MNRFFVPGVATGDIPGTRVQSSSIASVGYAGATATLEIEFRTGRVYRFFAVPSSVYDGLLAADSKGAYFNRFIRDRFPYSKG